MLDIHKIAPEIHQENTDKGFWKERLEVLEKMDKSELFTEKEKKFVWHSVRSQLLLHIVCEIGEAEEALRKDRYASLMQFGEHYSKTGNLVEAFELHIKDTYEDEIADALIRIFDLTAADKIDIEQHIVLKRLYNKTRPYKHGKNS